MGLEAINFFFSLKEPNIRKVLESNSEIERRDEKRYVYKKENLFWIDLEVQHENSISIRITLCNPMEETFKAFDDLLRFLFSYGPALLENLNTKGVFRQYDTPAYEKIIAAYKKRKEVFERMYGNYTAAISSEEFSERKRNGEVERKMY